MDGHPARTFAHLAVARALLMRLHMSTDTVHLQLDDLVDIAVDATAESDAHVATEALERRTNHEVMVREALERSAAYNEARRTRDVMTRAKWPPELARPAALYACAALDALTQSFDHGPTTAARRRCLRNALLAALELTTLCDIARAQELASDEPIQCATRMLSLISMAYQATCVPDDD